MDMENHPEEIREIARVLWQLFNALQDEGFNESQALVIICDFAAGAGRGVASRGSA